MVYTLFRTSLPFLITALLVACSEKGGKGGADDTSTDTGSDTGTVIVIYGTDSSTDTVFVPWTDTNSDTDSLSGTDTLSTDNPGTDTPGTDNPGTDNPGTDNPGTDNPGTDNPDTDNPDTDNPGTDNPGTDNPGTDPVNTDPENTDPEGTDVPEKNPLSGLWVSRVPGGKMSYNVLAVSDDSRYAESFSALVSVGHFSGALSSIDTAAQQFTVTGQSAGQTVTRYGAYADADGTDITVYLDDTTFPDPTGRAIEGDTVFYYHKVNESQCHQYVVSADVISNGESGSLTCGYSADMNANYCTIQTASESFVVATGYPDFEAFQSECTGDVLPQRSLMRRGSEYEY